MCLQGWIGAREEMGHGWDVGEGEDIPQGEDVSVYTLL